MFLKSEDRIKKFENLAKEIGVLIDKSRYEDAIYYYSKVNDYYNSIPDKLKTIKLRDMIERINRQLILYMKILELHTLISENKLARVPEIIEYTEMVLDYLKENMPEKQSLIAFGTEKLEFYKQKSEELHENLQFNSRHMSLHVLINRKEFEKAKQEIAKLEELYREISFHRKNLFLYQRLQKLKDELRLAEEKESTKQKMKHFLFEKHTTEKIKPEYLETLKPEIKKPVKELTQKEIYDKIHNLLKKNNLKEAQKLMKGI